MAAEMSDVLRGLDGEPLTSEILSAALSSLSGGGGAIEVTGVDLMEGSENKFPTSHSAVLQLRTATAAEDTPPRTMFLKKVTAAAMAHKPWADRQRTLKYIRTELRFYDEFAPQLAARGVPLPKVGLLRGQLECLGDDEVATPARPEPSAEELVRCGALLFLEPIKDGYEQGSPLAPERALVALAAAARLHAAAWEDKDLLSAAAGRLQRHGGAFALSIRNPKELTKITGNWEKFCGTFTPHAPELFAQPGIRALGERLERWSGWVAEQLSPGPEDTFATLVHGDFKAMNVFLPVVQQPDVAEGAAAGADTAEAAAVLIDFASTGVGFGMADVAMHLQHAITPADLADGGEERLVDGYLAALAEARGHADAAPYPRETALRHYKLAVVDYGRFIVGRFWVNATPESFAAKANSANTVLVNRNQEAALAFVERMDRYLKEFEAEAEAAEGAAGGGPE